MASSDAGKTPQFLILARVLRPHGVRGDLSVQVLTDFPERIAHLETVHIGRDPDQPDRMVQHRVMRAKRAKNDQWLLHLEGVGTREDADLFRGQYVCVALSDAVPLEDDEVYLFQVMGIAVYTKDGEHLGRVTDFIETGANDVYVVRGETYGEVLIPAIQGVILDINPETGIMTVDLPDGLLPDKMPDNELPDEPDQETDGE
jgi:16S rRNA processing protein RimM